jgi:uncharacterized membrane protein
LAHFRRPAEPHRVSPELAIARSAPRLMLLGYTPIAVAIAAFGLSEPMSLSSLIDSAYAPHGAAFKEIKQRILLFALGGLVVALGAVLREAWRAYRGKPRECLDFLAPLAVSPALSLLNLWVVEYEHPLLSGLAILLLAWAFSKAAPQIARLIPARLQPARAEKIARTSVLAGYALFVGWMGFMAYWRYLTFNAAAYDMSWETNAVHGIVHNGFPTTSVGAGFYYPGQHLPTNYAGLHTPWIYYVYAPFYALYQHPSTIIWLQAMLVGSGAFGVYWFARRQLLSPLLAATFALGYLAMPHVQLFCMHDIHANVLAIPCCLLALGAMEKNWHVAAVILALLTCICREETAVYGIALGLYWITSRTSVKRVRAGGFTLVMSLGILLLITRIIMPGAGGTPRYSHFGLYFDDPSIASLVKSLILNPWGALSVFLTAPRPEFIWLSLLPFGLLALLGLRGWPFLLAPIGLLLPSGNGAFFSMGVNYSAPIVVPVVVMSILGARRVLFSGSHVRSFWRDRRLALAVFVLTTAACGTRLYGNVFGKTYKFEFGGVPYRNSHEYEAEGFVGVVRRLPAFGPRERLLWDVIEHVPKGVPISTSTRINPQLSNRSVSMLYPMVGQGYPKDNQPKYIVIDRLPSLYDATEEAERSLLASGQYRKYFENAMGVILERKR